MELDLLVGLPSVVFYVVDFTGTQLHFLNVFVATQSVNFRGTDADGRKEGFFLDHGSAMHNITIDILKAVISHATKKEPASNVRVLVNGQWVQALTTSVDVESGEVAGEFSAVLGD